MILRSAALLAVAVTVAVSGSAAQDSPFVIKHAGFTAADLKRIDRGEVVTRPLTADGGEVALAAAALVRAPVRFYLERFRGIESFKRSAEVLQIGRFSDPPTVGDLRNLTIDADDIEHLRACRPGKCDLKLPDEAMARMSGRTDLDTAFREWLAEYVARYLREGNNALAVYHHEKVPRRLADPLRQIVERLAFLRDEWPALGSALGGFTGRLPAGLEQFVYWSKEKPPGKVVINVTHVVIQPETAGTAVLATKQIYASRYMHASLGVSVLIDRTTSEGPRTLVVYMNRTHVDLFDGLGRMIRPIVRSRARGSSERMLRGLRTRLEADWSASQGKD